MGSKTYDCENKSCCHTKVICHTCKSRFCNSCGQKATEKWIAHQGEILPDCEYRHLTFTMPDVFWEVFKLNRSLLNPLFAIAAQSLLHFAKQKNLTIGMFAALHTYGRQLNFNTHIHLSLAKFALNKHGTLVVFYFPFKRLMGMWRKGIIDLLRAHYDDIILPEELAQQIRNESDWIRFIDIQYNRHWQVNIAKKTSHKNQTKNYLGKYLKKPPIAAARLQHMHNDNVTFEYLDHRTNENKYLTISTEEMLIRLLSHIPEKYFRMIRYFGFLSNRLRGTLLPIIYEKLGQTVSELQPVTFASMMKNMLRTDPYQCILCGGRMRFTTYHAGLKLFQLRRNIKNLALLKPV